MSNEDNIQERHVLSHGEDTPDVEGHIRPAHTSADVRYAGPSEARPAAAEEDEGPDVEGHVIRF